MKKTLFALAAGLFAITASAASAMPTAATKAAEGARATMAHVQLTQYRNNRDWKKRHYRNRHMHRHDRRYDRYRGWNRYYSRPYSWRSRGCIAVGPIWFCP